MSMEGSKSFVPQEAVGGPKKEAAPKYNPMVSVRRDFDPEQIYREKGRAVIDDADHRQIMAFYRGAIVPGILLDLGAGPTHLHFMGCLEDKLTHIIALDLSKDNLRVVAEFLDSVGPEAKIAKGQRKFISDTDLRILKITAEASANVGKRTDKARSGESVLKSIREKSLDQAGKYDFIVGDMHDLDRLLGERKFDNIMIGYALFANKPEEIPHLFEQARRHLNPGGKMVIEDFQGFSAETVEGEYDEDEIVKKKYPNAIDYSLELLVSSLVKAGFNKDAIHAEKRDIKAEGEEKARGWKYLFVSAENRV